MADAALRPEPTLPVPHAWPARDDFSRTSGTGRLVDGALEWTDWLYDDYGAVDQNASPTNSVTQNADPLSPARGSYVYPDGPAANDGADIFRAAVALTPTSTVWRVDWNTLVSAKVPIAEWTFDMDGNRRTGGSAWPAGANVTSPGIDRALVVSAAGARLLNVQTGATIAHFRPVIDLKARSFLVDIPRTVLAPAGSWRVRLAAGLADATGTGFAVPTLSGGGAAATDAPRVYNVTFRSNAQEPSRYEPTSTAGAAAAAKQAEEAPVVGGKGVNAVYNLLTSNFWAEADQADTLASRDVSKFVQVVHWPDLAGRRTTQPRVPFGWSDRWYVTSLPLGQGVSSASNANPAFLGRVQPYAVYVPKTYHGDRPAPLSWYLHSASVNYRQYGAVNPRLTQQFCEERNSICVTPEGFGANGLYVGDAENDFWSVWREISRAFDVATDRTAVTGYSMGGLGSFTLPHTYPSLFAAAMPLDGGFDDRCSHAPSNTANFDLVDAVDRSRNVRWVPYVISDSYTDELSPYPNNAELVRRLYDAGDRFELFSTTMPEHVTTDSADGFSTQVKAVGGTPTATRQPGSIDYTWCADVVDRKLGLGPSSVYWLSGLAQRTSDGNAVSRVIAADAARPDRPPTEQLGTAVTASDDAPPMHVVTGTWSLASAPRAAQTLTLTLTNVAGLTVDTDAASLPQGTARVVTDGATLLTLTSLRPGTVVRAPGGTVTAGRDGTARVPLPSGDAVIRW